MLNQIMLSELLVELSTEAQQQLAGGQLFTVPALPVVNPVEVTGLINANSYLGNGIGGLGSGFGEPAGGGDID
jgi:hypothetical protein